VKKQKLNAEKPTTANRPPAANLSEVLLDQDEAAARLKVTVRTLVRHQNDGVVPFIELGKAVRFYWPAVISHLIANFMVTKRTPHGPAKPGLNRQGPSRTGNQGRQV
jgi:hypothetical protein